ncbi:hypothetical protein Trad_1361 [Truepera radiovictrix DSM 17093]|uniref:Uncharacterized protein n=1 Tax=Truepera radiovictrix (strain DSM 17093 / CIP 108686 / LMG 22925 / RQ-24) TaxID=649638 RepID=D7CWX5_TRURR|nr:hypothetical protein Trad_1361 [Truepera radiovictrix DSM 17093]
MVKKIVTLGLICLSLSTFAFARPGNGGGDVCRTSVSSTR